MKNVTLLQLKTQIRQISDQENSGFIQDPELITYINQSIAELYDKLVECRESDFYRSTKTITTVPGQESYGLPADFYQLLGIDLIVDSNRRYTLEKYSWNERNQFRGLYYYNDASPEAFKYRLTGQKIDLTPVPQAGKQLVIHYVPVAKTLALDADTFDGINGWELYVIYDCAIKIMTKEETDASLYMKKLSDIHERITRMKKGRDAGKPEKVSSSKVYGIGTMELY